MQAGMKKSPIPDGEMCNRQDLVSVIQDRGGILRTE